VQPRGPRGLAEARRAGVVQYLSHNQRRLDHTVEPDVLRVEVQREDWARATTALEHAIEKGGLSNLANAELLLGIAFYSRAQLEEAKPWFERAASDEAYRAQAEGWLEQIEMELATKS
jgi:hypothetical protein